MVSGIDSSTSVVLRLLQSSFVAENPVSSLMEEGVATWNRFVVESIGKQYKQETEMRIEWIELYGSTLVVDR